MAGDTPMGAGGAVSSGGEGGGALEAGSMAGAGAPPARCTPGEQGLCVTDLIESVCDAEGLSYEERPCPEGQFCLNGRCGVMRCAPGALRCSLANPDQILSCDPSGTEWLYSETCPPGDACRNGVCVSGCEAASKLNTYIGCEYWTVDLDNYPDPFTSPMPNEVPHSVVIANPSDQPAQLRFVGQHWISFPGEMFSVLRVAFHPLHLG